MPDDVNESNEWCYGFNLNIELQLQTCPILMVAPRVN